MRAPSGALFTPPSFRHVSPACSPGRSMRLRDSRNTLLSMENPKRNLALIASAFFLAAGIGAGGFLVGKGMARFKADVRTVTVKGLVEREVPSDEAVWTLSFRRASVSLDDGHSRLAADREAVLAFLRERGFTEKEIEVQPSGTVDRHAMDHGGQPPPRLRFLAS